MKEILTKGIPIVVEAPYSSAKVDQWMSKDTHFDLVEGLMTNPPYYTAKELFVTEKNLINRVAPPLHAKFFQMGFKLEGLDGRIYIVWRSLGKPHPFWMPLKTNKNAIKASPKKERLRLEYVKKK